MNKKEIKNLIRKEIKLKRENLELNEKTKLSSIIIKKFLNLEELKNIKTIMSYMDFKNEVETKGLNKNLLKIGKRVLIPKIDDENDKIIPIILTEEYQKGKYGILESNGVKFLENIDLIIVPGIVFNEKGERIGFGKGYYDKFLSEYENKNKKILKVSLLYEFQIDNRFNGEEHDKNIDILITERRIIKL